MVEIITLLTCLSPVVGHTTIRQLASIADAVLAMTGRISMLGISRWTENGGSYRTIQRFFYTKLNWGQIKWLFIRRHLIVPEEVILIAGDEVVVTKSGKKTYGLGRFFSSLYGKTVQSICFFSMSLISVKNNCSYQLMMEQVTIKKQPNEAKENGSHKSTSQKSKRGRPKGSRNKNRKKVELSPYLQFVPATLKSLLSIVGTELSLVYFVFDGAFGNNDALQMVRQCDLHLISKLRFDAALYLPYAGEYCGRGRRRKYGNKLNYKQLPEQFLKSSNIEGDIQTRIYQMKVWHKLFADLLNVVIIVKTNLKTGKTGHVILFSSDLELACEKLIEYYQLRFQIEFNFRDAKQYWGLEDFRNVSKNAIYNAANLAMFMVNLSSALLRQNPSGLFGSSVNDLKAWFRARKYVLNTLKLSEQNAHPIFIERTIHHVSSLGRVNPSVCQI
jgi:hypothetical protein